MALVQKPVRKVFYLNIKEGLFDCHDSFTERIAHTLNQNSLLLHLFIALLDKNFFENGT